MDTLKEETHSDTVTLEIPSQPPSRRMTGESSDMETHRLNLLHSRRPSAIIATLRRPSQTLALSAAHTVINQRKLVMEMMQKSKESVEDISRGRERRKSSYNKRLGDDALTTALSALYAKLIVVLGIAFPVTEIISRKVPVGFHQGFYLFLYSVSVVFMLFMYATLFRQKSRTSSQLNLFNEKLFPLSSKQETKKVIRYGSFYLRLGAIAFGIGSMVYSGLEFGQYFELKEDSQCNNVLVALTPAARMILTLIQMQFIFLNSSEMELNHYTTVSRFGIMHMIATNLCEWLYILVEETKHEIMHLQHLVVNNKFNEDFQSHFNHTNMSEHILNHHGNHDDLFECRRTNIMGSIVQNVSPFLYPCTVEYSLICAVILFEMWKHIKVKKTHANLKNKNIPIIEEPNNNSHGMKSSRASSCANEKLAQTFSALFGSPRSAHHFSVDCAGAHRGLFAGVLVIVMTIISLIIFFVLNKDPTFYTTAIYEVSVCELILYIVTLSATIIAMIQMRDLKYFRKNGGHVAELCLDTTLLIMAQSGVFLYCMFSVMASYFTMNDGGAGVVGLISELFALAQTMIQTMFIIGAWWKRCRSKAQIRKRPGRQAVTFLLVANVALWTTNTLEKGRAEFRPTHLGFFGIWPWTIITHVAMPMAIFYRFHSTICLFEIWKTTYKMKAELH